MALPEPMHLRVRVPAVPFKLSDSESPPPSHALLQLASINVTFKFKLLVDSWSLKAQTHKSNLKVTVRVTVK